MTQHVLHILPTLNCSGAGTQVALLSRELPQLGFTSGVLSVGGVGPMQHVFESQQIRVDALEPQVQLLSQGWRNLRTSLLQQRPDVIHCWSQERNLLGVIAAAVARIPRIVVSYSSIPTRPSWKQRTCERWLNRQASKCLVDSQASLEMAKRALPVASNKLRYIPLAVDPIDRPLSEVERQRLRNEWSIPSDAKLVGAVGPLRANKRLKDLIWAADLLKVIRDDIYLVVVGAGAYRPQLERYCRQVRITDRVRFVGDYVDAARMMGALDLLWQASDEAGSPQVVLEAMAAQVPVIATNTESHRELITPDQTGLLVPVGHRADFAKMTQRIFDSPELAGELTRNAQRSVTDRFSRQSMVEQFASVYREA